MAWRRLQSVCTSIGKPFWKCNKTRLLMKPERNLGAEQLNAWRFKPRTNRRLYDVNRRSFASTQADKRGRLSVGINDLAVTRLHRVFSPHQCSSTALMECSYLYTVLRGFYSSEQEPIIGERERLGQEFSVLEMTLALQILRSTKTVGPAGFGMSTKATTNLTWYWISFSTNGFFPDCVCRTGGMQRFLLSRNVKVIQAT